MAVSLTPQAFFLMILASFIGSFLAISVFAWFLWQKLQPLLDNLGPLLGMGGGLGVEEVPPEEAEKMASGVDDDPDRGESQWGDQGSSGAHETNTDGFDLEDVLEHEEREDTGGYRRDRGDLAGGERDDEH